MDPDFKERGYQIPGNPKGLAKTLRLLLSRQWTLLFYEERKLFFWILVRQLAFVFPKDFHCISTCFSLNSVGLEGTLDFKGRIFYLL